MKKNLSMMQIHQTTENVRVMISIRLTHRQTKKKPKTERLINNADVPSLKEMIDLIATLNASANNKLCYFDKKFGLGFGLELKYDILKISNGKYFAIDHQTIYRKNMTSDNISELERSSLEMIPVQDIDSGTTWLLKKYNVSNEQLLKKITHEIQLLEKVRQLAGSEMEKKTGNTIVYIVKHYAPGHDLLHILRTNKELTVAEKIHISQKIIEALLNIHQQSKLLHCDLKLENIIYDKSTDTLTLTDFDVSLEADAENKAVASDLRGSPGFIAPELLKQKNDFIYNEQTETYALGKTLAEWFALDDYLLDDNNKPSSTFFTNRTLSPNEKEILGLMRRMTDNDPQSRISLAIALKEIKKIISEPDTTPKKQM